MQKAFFKSNEDSEKEFCVKNIPANYIDWDLFRIFYKYGTIHNVKIPLKQTNSNNKYGFVIMEDINGADEVRSQLKNGKYLITDDGLQLLIGNTRNGENQCSRDEEEYCNNKNRLKEFNIHTGATQQKRCRTDKLTVSKIDELSAVKCFSQDLPVGIATKVRVVDSPYTCQCVDDGFVFHIVPLDQTLGEEYAVLQLEMNKFCSKNPNLQALPEVGQYVLFFRSNIAYRAICNSASTVYLIDTGEIVPIRLAQLWNITNEFALLPGLVVPCSIFGISWTKPSTVVFNNCRNALKQWSDSYVNGLTATANKYSGLINMVQLEAVADGVLENFAVSITLKGLCRRQPSTLIRYSREVLFDIRNSEASKRIPSITSENYIEEIMFGLQCVSLS